MYRVNEVAKLSGVSVRTLHHYDQIGLLKPSFVADNGYRYYDDQSIARLQQILFFKELGFKLQRIREIMSSEDFDQKDALIRHRELLKLKKHRLEKIIRTVNQTIDQLEDLRWYVNKEIIKYLIIKVQIS
ncbi:MerR family transcriptional regulator [Bacillaceae bacterium W0354]